MHLIAIILTYNEATHIAECIESVGFADRVLVFDSFSQDATVTIAKATDDQVEVQQRQFDNYASQRNAALDAARALGADWVLFVDADERISPALAREVRAVLTQPGYAGWRIPRHNFIFGKLTRGAGWYPDYQTRLLKIGAARYDPERQVHEVVQLDAALGTLTHPIIHYNYRNLAQFVHKQQRYTAYEAKILYDSGVRPKFRNFILQPLRQFKWRYFELKGYQDGWHGLRLCLLMAWYEFRKYRLLRGMWQRTPTASGGQSA